jgi:GT2 family glycosyltransferase/predicted SAM-dependent methyltransferase
MKSIIIPCFNQHDMTEECILAVRENTQDYELIIVDNSSSPPIHTPFTGFVETTMIRNEENKGFPVAVNQGIAAAKGDVIILLNNDVVVTPGWAEKLTDALEDFSIVGPLTNYVAGFQRAEADPYENREELDRAAKEISEEFQGEIKEVNFVIGFCMAFKKSIWEEIGPFDESLWPCSGEEIDFCFRARAKGYRVGIALDCYVHHEGSKTLSDLEKAGQVKYEDLCKRNDTHLAEKWGKDFWQRQEVMPEVEGIRINLGCGRFHLPGFINIDQFESVKPDLIADVTNLPYELGTISEIYAGHLLEHFRKDDGMKALRYWWNILKPGGKISVCVPDYDFLVRQYVNNPGPEQLIVFNDTYIYSGIQPSPHQYAYSAALLEKVMKESGFVDIVRMPVNHPYFPEAVDWQVGFTGVRP